MYPPLENLTTHITIVRALPFYNATLSKGDAPYHKERFGHIFCLNKGDFTVLLEITRFFSGQKNRVKGGLPRFSILDTNSKTACISIHLVFMYKLKLLVKSGINN